MNKKQALTLHALDRSRTRGIPLGAIEAAMAFGIHRATRGADFYTLGWREVREAARHGHDFSRWEGIEVVCSHDDRIMTVYRNRNPWAFRDRENRKQAA